MAQTRPALTPFSHALLRWIGDGGLATRGQIARRLGPAG
jgi:hypothetical protein